MHTHWLPKQRLLGANASPEQLHRWGAVHSALEQSLLDGPLHPAARVLLPQVALVLLRLHPQTL
eukprot:3517767-Pyramimonas_sp.AAC.1